MVPNAAQQTFFLSKATARLATSKWSDPLDTGGNDSASNTPNVYLWARFLCAFVDWQF